MIFSIERFWEHYKNKYRAINIAALYARKVKDEQLQGLIDKKVNPIKEALIKCSVGVIKYKE
uniref:DNA-directed RNA polymerase n=1 Tax=candidate division WOR-3 bacterium TaxID=2052148 RepID=A0A7C6EHF2_UNCW3